MVAQWCLTSHVAIVAALRLLQGNRLEKRIWAKPRSASFYQDIVPGWNDANLKANFCISRATFAYLVNKLQPAEARVLTQYYFSGPACCSLETGNQRGVPDD